MATIPYDDDIDYDADILYSGALKMGSPGYTSGRLTVAPGALYATDGKRHAYINPLQSSDIAIEFAADDIASVATLATSAFADDIFDTVADHGLLAGDAIYFSSLTGGSGGEIVVNKVYYVSATSLAARTFRLTAAASPDTPLGFSGSDITAGTVKRPIFIDNPLDHATVTSLSLTFVNETGGTMPLLSFGSEYVFAATAGFSAPADGASATYAFAYSSSKWRDQAKPVPYPAPRTTNDYAIDCSKGLYQYLGVTTNGAITVSAPTNGVAGDVLRLDVYNGTGGVITSLTMNAAYAIDTAPTKPASTKHLRMTFVYDGTNWNALSVL